MVSDGFNQEILALLSKRDKADWELLHWAAFWGYERIIQRLLEKGADIAREDRSRHTALSTVTKKGQEAVVESFEGADMESKDGMAGRRYCWPRGTGTRRL